MANEQQNLTWQAPEFRHYHKNLGWHITFFAVTVLIIGYQIVQQEYFAAISLAIIGGFVWVLSRQTPKIVDISLTTKGITVDELHIPYKTVKHFWVVNTDNHKTLNIETTSYLNRILILELADQDPDEIREYLLSMLPEHHKTRETMAQRLMHKLKI